MPNDVLSQSEEPQSIDPEEYTLQYGPKTMDIICKAVDASYKIFWDGAISNYSETNKSAENNKAFLNKLLEMRANTE